MCHLDLRRTSGDSPQQCFHCCLHSQIMSSRMSCALSWWDSAQHVMASWPCALEKHLDGIASHNFRSSGPPPFQWRLGLRTVERGRWLGPVGPTQRSSVRYIFIQIRKKKNSSKNIFVQNHFIQNRRQFHPLHFHPKTVSSNDTFMVKLLSLKFFIKTTFIKKPLSSKTIFIKKPLSSKNQFHQRPLSSKTTFIKNHFHQNQFHQRPFSSATTFLSEGLRSRGRARGGPHPHHHHHPSKNNIDRCLGFRV